MCPQLNYIQIHLHLWECAKWIFDIQAVQSTLQFNIEGIFCIEIYRIFAMIFRNQIRATSTLYARI